MPLAIALILPRMALSARKRSNFPLIRSGLSVQVTSASFAETFGDYFVSRTQRNAAELRGNPARWQTTATGIPELILPINSSF